MMMHRYHIEDPCHENGIEYYVQYNITNNIIMCHVLFAHIQYWYQIKNACYIVIVCHNATWNNVRIERNKSRQPLFII